MIDLKERAKQTADRIIDDLADRRGIPRDLKYDSDWSDARRAVFDAVHDALCELDHDLQGKR